MPFGNVLFLVSRKKNKRWPEGGNAGGSPGHARKRTFSLKYSGKAMNACGEKLL